MSRWHWAAIRDQRSQRAIRGISSPAAVATSSQWEDHRPWDQWVAIRSVGVTQWESDQGIGTRGNLPSISKSFHLITAANVGDHPNVWSLSSVLGRNLNFPFSECGVTVECKHQVLSAVPWKNVNKWALLHPSMIFWWLWQIVNSGRLLEHLTCLVAKKCWGEPSVKTLCGASSSCSHALHMDKHQNKKSRCSNFKNCEYLACNFDKRLSLKRLLVGWWRQWLRSRGEQTPWWRRSKPGRRVSVPPLYLTFCIC